MSVQRFDEFEETRDPLKINKICAKIKQAVSKLPSIMPHKLNDIFTKEQILHPKLKITFSNAIRRQRTMKNHDKIIENEKIGTEAFYQYYDTYKNIEAINRTKDQRHLEEVKDEFN